MSEVYGIQPWDVRKMTGESLGKLVDDFSRKVQAAKEAAARAAAR